MAILHSLIYLALHTTEIKGQIIFNLSSDERKLHFRYSDNGTGMDEETVKRIFEPFFTTKRGAESTGLGRHIVYNIVTQTLGEKVRCASSKGNGAVFDITIPLHENAGP